MGWAVILLPDERGDRAARRVWQAVSQEGFPSDMFGGENRPHVSLIVLDGQDGTLEEKTAAFAARTAPLPLAFASVGSFGQDAIYLSPQPLGGLLAMHRALVAGLGPLIARADGHYLPGEWQPHMTVAFDVPPGDYRQVSRAVRRSFLPFTTTFSAVAVVKFHPIKVVRVFDLAGGAGPGRPAGGGSGG